MTDEDQIIRAHILNLMGRFETSWTAKEMCFDELPRLLNRLNEIKNDELAAIFENRIKVT